MKRLTQYGASLALCLGLYAAAVLGYVFWETYEAQEHFLRQVDQRLLLGAETLKYLLPEDFHDRAVDEDAIPYDEELRIRKRVTGLALDTDFEYLYTLVEKDGHFYFAAATVTEEEAKQRKSWYFYPYDDIPEAFVRAYREKKTEYCTYTDQWGTFRSVAIPQVAPGGHLYLACADYDLGDNQTALYWPYVGAIVVAISFFALAIPFVIQYAFTIQSSNRQLQAVNAKLAEHKAHLEDEVVRRTVDLEKARQAAEEANRLKSRFVFNVSHEMRTPLNGILGFCEALLTADSIETAHSQAKVVLRESETLLMLINDLLDNAKIESGKMELESRPLVLGALLDNVTSSMGVLAEKRGLEFRAAIIDEVPAFVKGDFLRLRQVLVNLISNAIKFTEKGSVTVKVESLQRTSDDATLRFSVADTGIGIPKEKHETVFASFTQGDLSTTRKYGGTGLGTSIARQLVELMGGKMGLDSEPGRGSTFWFDVTLPLCERHECLDPLPEKCDPTASLRSEHPGKILIADDYHTNQAIARLFLEKAGHTVTVVDNGAQAVAVCCQQSFDLILMDLQMPIMDGQQATAKIRAGKTPNSRIPILAMTASAESSTREACIDAEMDDVIVKPIRRATFLVTVDQWLTTSYEQTSQAFSPLSSGERGRG